MSLHQPQMKRISLTIIVLCLWQTCFGQEKKAKEQQNSKVEKTKEELVVKAQHDVNLKIEKEKEEKSKPQIVFGESRLYPLEIDEHFDSVTLYELKRKYTKEFYHFEVKLDFGSQYELHLKSNKIADIDYEKKSGNSYEFKIPALKANRYYFLVTTSSGKQEIIEVFDLMKDEGNETCCGEIKQWMLEMQELSKSAKPHDLYYYPTLNELNSFQKKIKGLKINFEKKSDSLKLESLKTKLLNLAEKQFKNLNYPAANQNSSSSKEKVSKKDRVFRFCKWLDGRDKLNNEDTWTFADSDLGIGKYYDYHGLYEFYDNYRDSAFKGIQEKSENLKIQRDSFKLKLAEFDKEFAKQDKNNIAETEKKIVKLRDSIEAKTKAILEINEEFVDLINEKLEEYSHKIFDSLFRPNKNIEFKRFKDETGYLPNYLKTIGPITKKVSTISTHPLNFEKSFKRSLVPDFGLLVNRFPGNEYRGLPYVGVHIPFAPVNRDVSMAQSKLSFSQRTSLHVGITLSSIAEDNIRDDLFNDYSLMLGFGHKVIHHALRINTGVIAYNKIDAVNGDKSFALTPYLGLSIDIEIRRWLEEVIPSFTGNFKKAE